MSTGIAASSDLIHWEKRAFPIVKGHDAEIVKMGENVWICIMGLMLILIGRIVISDWQYIKENYPICTKIEFSISNSGCVRLFLRYLKNEFSKHQFY